MKKSEKQILEEKIPFVHSLLESFGLEKLTKELAFKSYMRYRPGDKKDGVIVSHSDQQTFESLLGFIPRSLLRNGILYV